MASPAQNINHSAFRSMLKREKLSGTNFNDWFRSLRLFLRVENKLFTIEQPIPPAPVTRSTNQEFEEWNKIYDVRNEELKSMFEKQAGVERFDLIQTFHACKQEEGKSVSLYAFKIKGYGEQLERLSYGKNKLVYVPKSKNHKPAAKEHPTKDDVCHHCKEVGHWMKNCLVYLTELMKKKKQAGTAGTLVSRLADNEFIHCFRDYGISVSKNNVLYFNVIPRDGIYEIDMLNLVSNVNSIYNASNKRAKLNLDSTYLWHCRLVHINMSQDKVLATSLPLRVILVVMVMFIYLNINTRFEDVKRDTPGKLQQRPVKCIFVGYPKETMGYYFYFPPKNKIIVARFSEFLEKNLISQKAMEEHSLGDLNEPDNYKSALLNLESNKWLDVMNAEMQSMIANQVWRLVDLPPYGKTIRSVDSDRTRSKESL
ncbi:retrotransposon protein, putative, ty1-copia subclass [Tanacetum coccineum]